MSEAVAELLRGAIQTRVTGVVAELGVADALAEGPRPVAEVADDVGADRDVLERFLRALASGGVFAEVEPGVWRNTESSALLGRETPWGAFAQLYGGVWHRAAGRLDAGGRPAFDGDFWTWLAEHPHERALFDLAMEEGTERRIERLDALEWRGDETVVDVGGGNGSLLRDLIARRPGLHGIVFDLPETARDEAALARAGIRFEAGSFFDDHVPAADVYVLGTVLHNWPDEQAAAILRAICADARPGARVLILDLVVRPDDDSPGVAWFGLLGLALFGARERTESEWRALLDAAGLRVDAVHEALIEARCP
jgi:MYXO-CTERM domain-containing protein